MNDQTTNEEKTMGRSVSYPAGAIAAFRTIDEEPDDMGFNDLDEIIDNYREWIKNVFPSFEDADKWVGREDRAIAENRFAYFGISEYCGLVALWLVKKDFDTYYADEAGASNLADRWLAQVEAKFRRIFGEYEKLGSMSNGEGVYRRKQQ